MSNPEPDDFVDRELLVGMCTLVEWRSFPGIALLGVGIGVATYLEETVSPARRVGVPGLRSPFVLFALAGRGAGGLTCDTSAELHP